ncbi:PREDICTED: fibrous sheath-interacting protein 2 [Galeopterus variegatus]|uniref:Fibrous sheath-interacting protein 2 n=1 Tax=Galeopterus variegatus TaxID=482537 RepID=A0ABM0QT78_GALVR|nr:PREDICTED: fibrous sheath-interacting protein 2 [Galeopterus variegatus]
MELYLSACSKTANVAAGKTATSGLAAYSQQCGDGAHKTHFPGVRAAQLLDLPLGVKLPMIPGSDTVFFTTKLSEKLFRPSYGFNLTDPYCRLLENEYKSLHDPHLRAYYKRKDILRRLKKGGYITSNNKVVCTLRELNKYRQYLTSLKLDFERNYVREQEMLAKQLHKLQENNQIPEHSDVAQFQNWLLQEGTHCSKDQERLIRHRYLDMISRELERLERTAEEQRLILMDREERQQQEHTRRKLSLRRKIEEEWKTKEMLLLTKIGEDVKRQQRIEEQRRKSREESHRKKQALLEKKMAYHLQKMQDTGFKGEDIGKNTFEYRGQDGTYPSAKKKKKNCGDIKLVYPVGDQKAYKGAHANAANAVHQSQCSSKNVLKKSITSVYQRDVQDNGTEQKRDGVINKKSSIFDNKGAINKSAQDSIISVQTSPTRNVTRSQSLLDPPKVEKETNADWNEKPSKRSNYLYESGPQTHDEAQGIFSSPVYLNIQQNLGNCLQEKITSEELNSIIQNIMTWVVATVTSILYPAITKYEERLQNNTYSVSDDSVLSSDSSSFCSTCSEEFTYGSYTSATTKTFQAEPCEFAVDMSVRRPTTSLKPSSAHKERTVVGKTHHMKEQSITSGFTYNKSSVIYSYPKIRSCKSDSHLLVSFETGKKKSKDATTETDGLVSPLFCDQKAKARDEMKNLKNVFVNFKCHLKEETQLILESIFQEIMSDLTHAIPSLSSVTAEVFVDQCEPEIEDLCSSVDICSVASEIVENMLEKLESAVEKKCVEMFSQEDLPVDIKPSLTPSEEYLISSNEKPLKDSLPYALEPMCDIADDMVHAILEKLMTLASCKQNELTHLEDTTKLSHQQHKTDPTYILFQRANEKKSSPEPDAANLIVKEEIQNLISNIFSQSSLVGYIEKAISTILGYVQTELNNERLIASEETVVLLQLLDDIFTQFHQEPVNPCVQKSKQPRLRNPPDTEEKYRLTGTRLSNCPTSGRPFPPVNVPGMVLYSEDDNEEIDKIVKNVLDSSFQNEKAKSQEQIHNHWSTKENSCFEHKRNIKPPTKPSSGSKVAFHDRGLKTELPSLNNENILKKKSCLNKDISIFSQDQKHQIQKASENIVKSILTEMLKDISSVPPRHLDRKTGKVASVFVSEKSQGLPNQKCRDAIFSVSEISTVAQEITDAVLNILYKASRYIPNTTKSSVSSSVHQTSLDNSDAPHIVKEAPNKKPLKIWFDSEKKMKFLSSLNVDLSKPSYLKSGESEPKPVDDIIDKIINTIFRKLKLFVCPKLQMDFEPSLAKHFSLRSQLSTYTTKVVNIVLHAIQNELELNKKNLNHKEIDHTKCHTGKGVLADTDTKLESLVTNHNDDVMASPLLTCIFELLLGGKADQRNILCPSDKPRSATSYASENIDVEDILPSMQDKKSFYKCLPTPCTLHSVVNEKDLKENAELEVLDRIGETLYEMLSKLVGAHPHSQPSCSQQKREMNEGQQVADALQSNIQLISKTILEYILTKLCSVDMDTSFASYGFKAVSESLDIDSLSFASILEETAKCTNIISSIVSRMIQEGKEVAKNKAKTIASVSSKTGSTKEMCLNNLKSVASDILNMVFDKLEEFANGNLETLSAVDVGNKNSNKMDWECESTSVFTDTQEELLQSALYKHAKKVSSAILKAIQTELNVNSDLWTSIECPPPETQMLKNIVNLISDAVSSDMFNETVSEERGTENYGYRPAYGNFLPGGAESDSFLEDDTNPDREFIGEKTPLREETHSLQHWVLERTLNKIEVKLKEPNKSPIIHIIRNILNEIFQSVLINQLNVLSLSYTHSRGMPHNVDEPIAQTSFQLNKMLGSLVSEEDVAIVADDFVRTVFHKLYSAAMTERNVSENRYKTIIFSADVSFHGHTYGGKPSVTALERNPCTLQSKFSVGKQQANKNVVEDIVQAILTNLETFTTSKVKSLFCSQVNFTVPMALPIQQDTSPLSKMLSAKDTSSDEQISYSSVDHIKSGKTNSLCLLSLSKLNIYATEVAKNILQGIKYELDKERESPFLTHNIVVSESIASQIVNTVLDVVSCKGKCDKNNSDKQIDSDQQERIIEKLFNKSEYRKVLQFQIQDTIEGILYDIYEKTLHQNNFSFATPTLKCSIAGKHSEANSEIFLKDENKIIPKLSVPKSDVILISNNIVDIVLDNLSSAVMLAINAKDHTSARLSMTFCDTFPKAEYQQPLLMEAKSERKAEYFPYSRNQKSAYADDNHITVVEKDSKISAPDPYEENVNFITTTIFNRLESFATERIDSLITLAFQPKVKSFVSPEFENCKQDDSIVYESSQVQSDVNILQITTNETILSQELDSTFASYREKLGSTIHLSQTSLKEYADIIASAILKLIKNDLDLEIRKMYPYPNNVLFQDNIILSEIVEQILKILYDKRSVKEISFYSKDNPNFSQFIVSKTSNEILLGHREKEENTKLSLLAEYPLEQNQMTLEKESQRSVLEEIFMRNGESKQKEKTELLGAVKELLNKLYQRVTEVTDYLPPFNKIPHFLSNSKSKTSDITQKNFFQSHVNSVASNIIESVLGKTYSVVVTSIYENNKSRGEVEISNSKDTLPMKPSCFRETKQAGKRSNPHRYVIPQIYSYADSQSVSVLENTFLQYPPLQVGKDLVQMVLSNVINFVSLHLEHSLSPEGCSDNPKPDFKTSLKARSKITSLPKFRAKPRLRPSGAKAKIKTKLDPVEKSPRHSQSNTAIGLSHIQSTGDAKNLLEIKLPTLELKMYAKDIVSHILETILKEFEKVKQIRAMVNIKALPADQIMVATEIVSTVLQELYAINIHNLAYPIKLSHLDELKHSQGNIGIGSLAKQQACFYLENVSSQLEQIFPKDGTFKKMFDKWQTELNDMENEKCKLLMIAENVLTEISIRANELEYSLSLLNLPTLEDCKSTFYNNFKGASTRANTNAQINMFGREIVEMLFEKLQLYFLSQMPTPDSKETLANRKAHITAKSRYDFPTKHTLSSLPTCNTKMKDQISMSSSNQIVREIVERVLTMLESFVDLQFKHISKYEFSEIVKMPVENLFPVQQRLLSKKMLPKLQPLKKPSDESKSSTIFSKENIQNSLLQVHSFHSELLTYATNTVSDMLGIIKNKLEKEISQMEPSGISVLEENIVASEIIGTLMDQCTHVSESLIKNFPMQNLFQGVENTYTVNQVELRTNMKIPTLKLKEASLGNNPPQISAPDLVFCSEEDMNKKYRISSNLPSYSRSSVQDTFKSSEPIERPDSEARNKVQDHRKSNFGHFDEPMKGNSSIPEGSVLQKLFKKVNDSAEAGLKQVMSFIEMGKGENPRVFHYETLKPVVEPNQIQTTVSPLKICLAAENIVNTVLFHYGLPSQPHTSESMETMKPFFISKQNHFSEISGGQKNEEKNLLRMWDKRSICIAEEENKNSEASWGDFSLLQKWQNKRYLKIKKIETLEEVEVIAFADHELGPNEIHLVARHVTTSVVTHFKNVETRVSSEEKVSVISPFLRKKYESKQHLRSIYRDSSVYQFSEHLTDLVIYHLNSSISDGFKEGREEEKAREIQDTAFNRIISIHSQVFESRSISIRELALSISGIIIKILFNSNIIEADIAQQMISIKTKYVYCTGVASADFDEVSQDLLIGVVHVLSREIGINHHFESNGRNESLSMLRNEINTTEKQTGPSDRESSHQIDQLIQKGKLNYLAYKLDSLVGSLKTRESKEVVNKVFNIVLDLFLPDECPDRAMDSDKIARTFFSSPNNQQSNSILRNNLGLSPKSVFLLNVVCEKLIRTLLEKCTSTVFLDNGPFSDEISAEECHLLKILQSAEDGGEFDYCKGAMDLEQLQGDYLSDLLENLSEIDQDLLSSDSMLTIISHSLVKSLMDKLSHSIQQAPEGSHFANKHFNYRTREIQSSFTKLKIPEFMIYDSNSSPLGKQLKFSSMPSLKKQETKETSEIAILNKLHQGGMNAGVYSATFLEEIISELFFNLSTSLWGKNKKITEARLNEMNTLFVNNVVNEFKNMKVTVVRNAEERMCFPPIHKETVSKIVDSVYYDVLQQYELEVTRADNLAYDNTSITQQITNSILLEILDYQLPSCFEKRLRPHSYYPLKAEIILQKLQNNLREFISHPMSLTGYSTMLSHSFLEDVIRRLLSQLIPPSSKDSCLGKKYLMSSDFNEMSTYLINKVMLAISKHKIWFTMYDNQYLCTGKNLQKMVDSVYSNILQMSDSIVSIQKSIVSQSPVMVDRIASFIIQEIIENHLQPFLREQLLPHPRSPLDEVSNMVKQVLSEVIESHRPQRPTPLGIYPNTFVGKIVARLLSKIFSPKHNSEVEVENMTQKIVNSINNHFDKAKIHIPYDDKEQSFPSVDPDIVDKLVTSVYRNVLKQHGLDPDIDKESEDSDIFVKNITNLVVAAISDYLLHPLLSGDLSASSYSVSMTENIIQDILSNISKSTKPSQSLLPYNTLLPYTFLEDMIRVLLSRFFPPASSMVSNREIPKDKLRVNFNEIASNLISDIRMKISQHEIRFSKDEEETKFVYSEDDVQHLVDSIFKNILQDSGSQELVEQNVTSSNDVLIDRIAAFIIKHICQQHLQPFMDRKLLSSSSYTHFDDERRQLFYASVYSSTFLEDVVSGVLSKIFHRVVGIVQIKSVRYSEDELFDKAEKLIHLITEEFSKAQVTIIDNAEEQLCLPPVERDIVKEIIDTAYSKVLQENEMQVMPNKDLLSDMKTLAERVTKIILAEIFDFQVHPDLIENLPFKLHSKLSANVLIKRVQYDIGKSRFQRQASTIYTTTLSHTHLEKIVSRLISQMSPSASSAEHPDTSQSDLSNTLIKLINEIMSIISKHAICIIKHGNDKQSMISEKDIQSMVDSIYDDLSYSNLYQSLTKDKKGISNIPVSKIASFIIKEIFNHHLQSFFSGDKTLLSLAVDQTYKQRAIDPKQRELSSIVNSAAFLEDVISELLCKILYAFSHNVLAAQNPDRTEAEITGIVTTLVKSIVWEFTASEILVADNFDENLCFSAGYKETVQKTVNPVYEKILDEYKSLIQVYRAIQSDPVCFGRKIYHLLLEEIYDYQVQSLVSGELVSSSYSSPQADNIISSVLSIIMKDSHALPSCITVLPRSLLEDMIYKLLEHIFASTDTEKELKKEKLPPDYEFVDAASRLTEEIIKEISEHEIRLSTAEENAESMQLEAIENLVDAICNNILKKSEFQAAVQKDVDKKGGSFLSKIAGFIMKEIMDHHLQPFLHGEESFSSDLAGYDHVSVLAKSGKEETQPSLYSATFLEDLIVELAHKFFSLPTIFEDSKKKEMLEPDTEGLAIKFANSLIAEFRKSDIKVLPNAEKVFSFPPIDKETVDKISNFVYDQFIGKYGFNDIQKDDRSNIVIEMVAALAQKAISAFKIQPLFSGNWSSTFFSFLDPDNITQRVQHLPQKASTQITRCLKGNQLTLPEQSYEHTFLTSDKKNTRDTLEIDRGAINSLKTKDTSMKKGVIQNPILSSITAIMKSNRINLVSESAAVVANKKKKDENKMGISIQKHSENVSKVTSPTTSVRRKDTQEPDLSETLINNKIERKKKSALKEEKGKGDERDTHFSVATDEMEYEKEVFEPDFEINEEKIGNTGKSSFKKNDMSFELSFLKSKHSNMGITNTGEELYLDHEHVQNVIESIYDDVLEISSSKEPADFSKLKFSKSSPGDIALNVIREVGKGSEQFVTTKNASPLINKNDPAKEEESKEKETGREKEKVSEKEIKSEPTKLDHPQYLPKSKQKIFPANFLEDVIIEMINKLIFSSSPQTQRGDRCQRVNDDQNQAELYDTAMKLIDSLLKEFSIAQIKVFKPNEENHFFSPAGKVSSVPKVSPKCKEPTTDKSSSNIKIKTDKMPHMHKMTKNPSLDKISFLDKMPSIDKTLVNKVVHSSICNILKEYRSQDSICKNINSNGENLARRLTSAVIHEIFQHQPNLVCCDEVPVSACLTLESKDIVKKVQKVAQIASKECQTSSPYTILLPYKFLEDVISALLSKIFSTISKTKAKTSEGNLFTELDFLQMRLVSEVATQISKDEDMIIQYVESLHPNDDEIIQLVVQSVYNNLLPQFGSQEIIQNCVTSGCRILSEAIVDLVLREVAGNQLQNYFSGELTLYQCAEVDRVVENILKDVIQTTDAPLPQPTHAHKLSYNIIEEIAIKFLSKLLSMFPKVHEEKNKSLENEMQKITSKILNSMQEYISKSKIKLVSPAKESPTIPLADYANIEKVVNSVYTSVLKHSGSHTSVFKDLMGKSNVLSDIIGFLMMKEISSSEFQPQVEEEASSSELVLEAVKITEKVVKIIDEFKYQEKSSSKKGSMLDVKFLEETLALFLAKLVKLPSASSKDAKNLTKPELNKIASQLTKSVMAEISRSNINLVHVADPEEHFLNPENIEMISQVVNSVYSNVLQQSGTVKKLYHDVKDTNIVFPPKVANLIIDGVSSFPIGTIRSKNANAGDLDIDRIVQKAQKYAVCVIPDLNEESDQDSLDEEFPVNIVPHVGEKPIKIDPDIISEHLAVISVKTLPLEKLRMECLRRTGHSIAELRRASISGKSYPSSDSLYVGKRKQEKRSSLTRTGRLDVKPLEAIGRNSFPNIRKPDITKVELLKDVHGKKDLIIRLVVHDIDQEDSERNIQEVPVFEEDEIVLGEIVAQGKCIGEPFEDQVEEEVEEVVKPVEGKVISPKPTVSKSSLKKILSLSRCCQPTTSAYIESTEATSHQIIESEETEVKRAVAELHMNTTTTTETDYSWQKKPRYKKEERSLVTEPTHYRIHRIMSSSSYNQDLISSASEADDCNTDPRAKILEENSQGQKAENANSVKFITIFEGSKDVLGSVYPSKEVISETPKSSTSKQGSKMLAKVSSALLKVFSRSNTSIPKSSSPPHQDEC